MAKILKAMKPERQRWGIGLAGLALVAVVGLGLLAVVIAILAVALSLSSPSLELPFQEKCVGLIKIEGVLSTEETGAGLFSGGTTGSEETAELIREAGERDDVQAVVLEINSPGGSVVASREIYEAIAELEKPKVAYFREVAASGGYYIAADADYIVSNPDAMTGSIGVRATVEDMSGLFEKLGINTTTIKSGEHKDMGDPSRPLTEEEKAILQGIVSEIFQEFRQVVEEGRGERLDRTRFEQVLDGRVLTGRQAREIGLVDELGNRKTALRKAAELANMSYEGDSPKVCAIERQPRFFEEFFGVFTRFTVDVLSALLKESSGARAVRLEY